MKFLVVFVFVLVAISCESSFSFTRLYSGATGAIESFTGGAFGTANNGTGPVTQPNNSTSA